MEKFIRQRTNKVWCRLFGIREGTRIKLDGRKTRYTSFYVEGEIGRVIGREEMAGKEYLKIVFPLSNHS